MTDVVAPEDVQDRIREFRIAVRTYSYVRACRRAGEEPSAQLPVGSLAVLCPACPQPGHNMRSGWENRQKQYKYVDALHFCVDGNFHFNLKPKHTDPKDVPLTLDAAYFGHEEDFKHYIATTKPYPNEPSTCSQFVAMGAGKYKGPVSGIVALVCRHNLVLQGGIVDLTKGEKFLYVDFTNISALQRFRSLRMLVMMYDINCQYIKNFSRRIQDQFAPANRTAFKSIHSTDIPATIIAGIGKYHAPMHTADCRPFHSLNNLPGAADSFGENAEQKWADIEGITRATKEMSAGHQHDKINDHNSHANARLVHAMVDHLVEKYKTAQHRLADAEGYLLSVEESIGDEALVARWRDEHDKWEENVTDFTKHAQMTNPFEVAAAATLTTQMIVAQLNDENERQGNRHGIALVDAMESAFRLESFRIELLRKIETAEPNAQECKKIAAKVENYRRDLHICHDEFEVLMAPAVAKAIEDANSYHDTLPKSFPRRTQVDDVAESITPFTDKPPSYELVPSTTKRKKMSRAQKTLQGFFAELSDGGVVLPSGYHRLVRDHVGLKAAVDTERKLREGLAAEALDKLRLHLTTHKALEQRRRQVSGVVNNTDVDRRLTEKRLATDRAKYEYRKNRHLLRVLGMPDNHPKFKQLRDSDCYAFAITAAEHRLGDSHRLPSWIWGDFSYVVKVKDGDFRQFLDDSLKAHWFRHSAFVRRWREAVFTRREEMYRTMQSYHANRELWLARADLWEKQARLGAAAFARRYLLFL
uniref:Copper resistance-associated P-type ATPase n=1 Tax=Ganoderma boninense TaxID=34458 RepID=A0A5K1JV65_9APHY|nr:Copper resistance-associated P-type ATPase [Ganoderma boninense]